MPRIPDARQGDPLTIKGRPLSFSFWPVAQTTRRYRLQSHIFAANPWPIIFRNIQQIKKPLIKDAALAFAKQAEDYYKAATLGSIVAAKPVLLYYCFMNLAKAFILVSKTVSSLDIAQHGLAERIRSSNNELIDAYLIAYPSNTSYTNIFDKFLLSVKHIDLSSKIEYDIMKILPQILPGHRLWSIASNQQERFMSIEKINFYRNNTDKTIWLRFYVFADDLSRLGITRRKLLDDANLSNDWQEVKCREKIGERKLLCFEQRTVINYSDRPSDKVFELVNTIKLNLWTTVQLHPPYRSYYLYLAPITERDFVLPQLLSIYAITYYLGSITRYRPHQFEKILAGQYGAVIEAFLNDQPTQFIYLLASEFVRQEVTKAAIV